MLPSLHLCKKYMYVWPQNLAKAFFGSFNEMVIFNTTNPKLFQFFIQVKVKVSRSPNAKAFLIFKHI